MQGRGRGLDKMLTKGGGILTSRRGRAEGKPLRLRAQGLYVPEDQQPQLSLQPQLLPQQQLFPLLQQQLFPPPQQQLFPPQQQLLPPLLPQPQQQNRMIRMMIQ